MENDPRNRRPSSPKGTPKGWLIKKSEAKALLSEGIDNSFDSLTLVEQALGKVRPRQKILEIPNLFAGIIAYTGEVYREMTGGHWRLNEVHGGIWEPYVHVNDWEYLNPFLEPYKDIAERRRGGIMLKPLVSASLPRPTEPSTPSA